MAFMKNINDLRGLFTLLVLTIPTIAANIDCNGKPFHCLNSTHFMICVDVGSGVSSTLDDFVIPCPPTTVCKGTNRFECEFLGVTTTSTVAPSVAPLATALSEITTPLYDVTTSIPFEEYYNTLSTTTLSEYVIFTGQTHVTESIVQPATELAQDVLIPGFELESNLSDIIQSMDVVQNNLPTLTLLPNNISAADVLNLTPNATENVRKIASEPDTNSTTTAAINIVQNGFTSLNTFTYNANNVGDNVADNATESILLEITETASSVTTITETIPSVDVVQDDLTTFLFINMSVNASDITSNATENFIATTTKPQANFTLSGTSRATEIVENIYTLLDAFGNTALPINADTTLEPHTQDIPGSTENVNVITSISLPNNFFDNVTESILSNLTKPLTFFETISSGNDVHIDTNTEPMFVNVTEMTPSESTLSKTTPITLILNGNNLNVEAVINDSKTSAPLPYESSTIDTENKKKHPSDNAPYDLTRTFLSDAVTDTITESILINVTQETRSVSIDSAMSYILRNTTSLDKIKDNVTELTAKDVMQYENAKIAESNVNLSAPALKTPSNGTLLSNIIESPAVTNMTEHASLGSTESKSTLIESSLTNNLQYDITTPLTLSSFASLNNTDAFVTSSMTTNITENPIIVDKEYHSNKTLRGSLSGKSVNSTPLYIQSTVALQSETEPTVTSNSMSVNTLTKDISKSNKTGKTNNLDLASKITEVPIDISYADSVKSTVTDGNAINFENTPNSILETTVFAQDVDSVTYSSEYINTNTENIRNYEGIFTNQAGGKNALSENVMSTGTVENIASTPTLAVLYNNYFTNYFVSTTNVAVPIHQTGLLSRSYTNTLIINNETLPSINKQKLPENPRKQEKLSTSNSFQGNTILGSESEDNVLLVNTLKNNGSLLMVNESGSDVPVRAASHEVVPTTEISMEPAYSKEAKLMSTIASAYDIIAKPVSNDNMLTLTGKIQSVNTEPTTLGTTFTTDTSKVVFSETANDVPASKISITEYRVSHAILPSPSDIVSDKTSINTTNTKRLTSDSAKYNNQHLTNATPLNTEIVYFENSSVFYPTTEVIVTEVADNSYAEPSLHAVSAKDKSKVSNVTPILPSLLVNYVQSEITSTSDTMPDITAPLIGDPDFNLNSQNKAQQENSNTNAPDLFKSSYSTELPALKFIEMEADIKKPESSTGLPGNKTLITNIFAAAKNVAVITEPHYPVNKVNVTDATADPNVLTENNPSIESIKAIKEHNPLINLLLVSPAEQTPFIIPAAPTETISLVSTPTPSGTATDNVSGDSSKTTTDSEAFVDVTTLQEFYTKSNVSNVNPTLQTYFQSKESKENRALADVHAIGYTDQENGVSKLAENIPERHKEASMDIETQQTIQVEGIEKSVQSSVDTIESSPLHSRHFITDKQNNSYLGELHNTGIRLTKTRETQSSTANYNSANTLEPKLITKPASISSIVDINTQLTHDNANTEGISINIEVQSNTGNDKNDATITEDVMLLNPVTDAVISTPNVDTTLVETQTSLGIISLTDVNNTPAVILNQARVTPILKRFYLTTQNIEPITESWRAIAATKPQMQITKSLIATQPMIHLTKKEPNAESFTVTGENTAPIATRLDVGPVLINPVKQYLVPQNITPLSNLDEKLVIEAKPHPDLLLTSESSSKVPQTSENNVQTTAKPILDTVASDVKIEKNINVSNKNNIDLTEFSTPNGSLNQTTERLDQVITQNAFHVNLDKSIVMVDAVKTEVPVLVEGNVVTGTHSGISVLPKPPRKSNVDQSDRTKGSGSIEKLERKDEQEHKEKPEAPESNESVDNITPVIDTTIANPKESIPETSLTTEQNVNENIDKTSKTITVGKSSVTNDKITLESTIEMTTQKVQDSDQDNQAITNIELHSSAIKSPTESFATQAKNADNAPKEKTAKNRSIISTHIINNKRSNIVNSTPTTKLPFANTHNASLPTIQSVTNSRNFVCKLNSRGRFSDSKDCRKFYICIGKPEPIEGYCPNNTVFSELRKQCTKNLSHCVRNNQFQCVWEGRFSDYLNDNIYYICVKNNVGTFIRFKLQCQSGYYINKTSVRCALNTQSSHSTSQQSTSDISKNNSDQSVSSAKTEKLVDKSSGKFECKKEGKFPDANNCRKYYVCTKKGKTHYRQKNKKCDSDELFHKDKKKCVDGDSYECN